MSYDIEIEDISDEVVKTLSVSCPFTVKESMRVTEAIAAAVLAPMDERCDFTLEPGKYRLKLLLVITEADEV